MSGHLRIHGRPEGQAKSRLWSGFDQCGGLACRIVKLVRALRKGWIQTTEQRKVTREEPPAYLLWADDGVASDKIANGEQPLAALPACRMPA